MRHRSGPSGSPAPTPASAISGWPAWSSVHRRSPPLAGAGSSSPGLCLLFRVPTARAGSPRARGERLPWGFVPPSRHQCGESTRRQGSRPCLRSAPGVSHTLDGFLLLTPRRPVSSGCHVQGFLFRGFCPPISRTGSSPARALLSFGDTRLRPGKPDRASSCRPAFRALIQSTIRLRQPAG
jgi:hypothetical protein